MSRLLVVAVARAGWGEATLGQRVARLLVGAGHEVHFAAHPALNRLFVGGELPVTWLGDETGPHFDRWVRRLVARERVEGVVLADLLMSATSLARRGASVGLLGQLGVPIIGIDTWNFAELPGSIDVGPNERLTYHESAAHFPKKLVPAPFCRPDVVGATRLLPAPATGRAEGRGWLGVGAAPVVLVCSSVWQQRDYADPMMSRAVRTVPKLLGLYLSRLGGDLRVVHVGPHPFDWSTFLGDRYLHVDRLAPDRFSQVVAASDLVLSTNASATTNALALVTDRPVVTVVNSAVSATVDAAWSRLGYAPSQELLGWMRTALPLYRFRMWPMAWFEVLGCLLRDNPYATTLNSVELLDERAFHETMTGLLRDRSERDAAAAGRRAALVALEGLPGPVQRVEGLLAT